LGPPPTVLPSNQGISMAARMVSLPRRRLRRKPPGGSSRYWPPTCFR